MMTRVPGMLLAGGLLWAQAPGVPPQPAATPEDLGAGERVYRTQCAYCHGPRGEGGRGSTLARPRLFHAADDLALFEVIQKGIPETEMPEHWFPPQEIWQVVAFVRTLGRMAPRNTPGDPAHGELLYKGKGGCAGCHTVNGRGGAIGPDLTDIGVRRSAPYLRQSLIAPEAAVPEQFLQVRLTARDGRRITGVRLNEDSFSIQIRDLSGVFQSFWKDDLTEIEKQWGKSPMPGYQEVFNAGELDDLIAYLDSLRGNP